MIWDAFKQGLKSGWEKSKTSTPNSMPKVTVSSASDFNYDSHRYEEEFAQREREVREGYVLRARALSDAGVDLEQFSEPRAVADALAIFDGMVSIDPVGWRETIKRAKVNLNPQNLTKAGKVPKNVVEAQIDGMPYEGPGVICYLKYMADGSINMADFHIWHNHIKHSVFVRTVDGDHRITSIERYDMKRDFRKQVFSDKKPENNDEGIKVLNHFLGQMA